MKLTKYLGRKASCLLSAEPFKNWPVQRWVDNESDPPIVNYSFVGCGLQLNCDCEPENVRSLFLEKESYAGTVLSEVPFNLRKDQVLARFGSPSKSGDRTSHPILGDFGPWDRFQLPEYIVHVQYKLDSDGIEKITLMRSDVAP